MVFEEGKSRLDRFSFYSRHSQHGYQGGDCRPRQDREEICSKGSSGEATKAKVKQEGDTADLADWPSTGIAGVTQTRIKAKRRRKGRRSGIE